MASPVEPHARIETVAVVVGERFPLAFHDEVLEVVVINPAMSSDRLRLTILRRGL